MEVAPNSQEASGQLRTASALHTPCQHPLTRALCPLSLLLAPLTRDTAMHTHTATLFLYACNCIRPFFAYIPHRTRCTQPRVGVHTNDTHQHTHPGHYSSTPKTVHRRWPASGATQNLWATEVPMSLLQPLSSAPPQPVHLTPLGSRCPPPQPPRPRSRVGTPLRRPTQATPLLLPPRHPLPKPLTAEAVPDVQSHKGTEGGPRRRPPP